MSHHFINTAKAQVSHQFPNFQRDEVHEILNVLWITFKLRTQFWILCRYANRTGIQMTGTHHDATKADQRRSCEPKFVCTE
jgi:hypothetical protein